MTTSRTTIRRFVATGALAWTLLLGARAHAQAQCISLESNGQFVRHTLFLGRVDPVVGDLGERDATFLKGPGLAAGSTTSGEQVVSFEATNYPGYYLRHQLYSMVLNKDDGTPSFKDDATFVVRPGRANPRQVSFESKNYPNHFIRKGFAQGLVIAQPGPFDATFDSDVTFSIAEPRSKSECGNNKKDPVIIVAGTLSPWLLYEAMRHRLQREGYNAYIFELPTLGMQDMKLSSSALGALADKVRARLRATKVDLIGHSQGAEVSRSYVKYAGGAKLVDSLISLGGAHYGTTVADSVFTPVLGATCVACKQLSPSSQYLRDLNGQDDAPGTVSYTNFVTKLDVIIQPYTSGLLKSTRSTNINVTVQDQCLVDLVDHIGMIYDGPVLSGILNALAHQPVALNCLAPLNLLP